MDSKTGLLILTSLICFSWSLIRTVNNPPLTLRILELQAPVKVAAWRRATAQGFLLSFGLAFAAIWRILS